MISMKRQSMGWDEDTFFEKKPITIFKLEKPHNNQPPWGVGISKRIGNTLQQKLRIFRRECYDVSALVLCVIIQPNYR